MEIADKFRKLRILKHSQYNNDATHLKNFLVLKLPPFYLHCVGDVKGGNFKIKKFFNWIASLLYWLHFKNIIINFFLNFRLFLIFFHSLTYFETKVSTLIHELLCEIRISATKELKRNKKAAKSCKELQRAAKSLKKGCKRLQRAAKSCTELQRAAQSCKEL